MAVLSADFARTFKRSDLRMGDVPIAATTTLYQGAFCCANVAGYAVAGADTSGFIFLGVAEKQFDNSAGSAGDLVAGFRLGGSELVACTGASQAWQGEDLYLLDDNTVGIFSQVTNGVFVGTCEEYVSATSVYVRTSTAGSATGLKILTVHIPDISTANSTGLVYCPFAGTIVSITSVLGGAITVGDATITNNINAVAITGGALTIANAGSALGIIDEATPTAANVVAAGDYLQATSDGGSTDVATLDVTFTIA